MESDQQKIPALKLFVSQLNRARRPDAAAAAAERMDVDANLVGLELLGIEFTRVWLQGIVVGVDTLERIFLVDDGTGTVTAAIPPAMGADTAEVDGADARRSIDMEDSLPEKGHYVLLVGAVLTPRDGQRQRSTCGRYRLLCDVVKDLGSEGANRELLWDLEVVNFWRSRLRASYA